MKKIKKALVISGDPDAYQIKAMAKDITFTAPPFVIYRPSNAAYTYNPKPNPGFVKIGDTYFTRATEYIQSRTLARAQGTTPNPGFRMGNPPRRV